MMKPEVIKIRSKRPKQSQWFDEETKPRTAKTKDQYKRKPKHNKREW